MESELEPRAKLPLNTRTSRPLPEVGIIADDTGVADLLTELLEPRFRIASFSGMQAFAQAFLRENARALPDLIVCDAHLRDGLGLELLRRVRKAGHDVPFVLMVSQPDPQWTAKAYRAGVTDLLEKPFESFLFIEKFQGHIARARHLAAEHRLRELLLRQLHLLTAQVNRGAGSPERVPYLSPSPEKVREALAQRTDFALRQELDQCRSEYLALAERLGIP